MEDFFLPISFSSRFPILAGITTSGAGNSKFPQKRREMAHRLDIPYSRITTGDQVHKNNIAIVREKDLGRKFPVTDGLITDLPNVPLAIFVADCPPVFLFDPRKKVIGLLHAGWRSTVAKISSKAVEIMSEDFGVKAEDLLVAIGPHICKECYRVSWSPVAKAFRERFEPFGREVLASIVSEFPQAKAQVSQERFWSIDLARANSYQLQRAGVLPENIEISPSCTYEDKNLFSYRRDKSSAGRLMAIIQLKRPLKKYPETFDYTDS
jgi:hypothetical protein